MWTTGAFSGKVPVGSEIGDTIVITWVVFGKRCTKVVPCDRNRACVDTRRNGSRRKSLFQAWGRGDIHAGRYDSRYRLAETVLEGASAGYDNPFSSGTLARGRSSAASNGALAPRSSPAVARVSGIESPTGRVRSSEAGGSTLMSSAEAGGGGGQRSLNEGLLSSDGGGFGRLSSDGIRTTPRLSSGSKRRGRGMQSSPYEGS